MHPFQVIDAFTLKPHAGNPAAVVFVGGQIWPEPAWMARCAAEFALSETAFVLEEGSSGSRGLRWFTPSVEVPLCGHATLATAHALWSSGRQAPDQRILFGTVSGDLSCTRRRDGAVTMDFPSLPVSACPAETSVLQALGLKAVMHAAGDGHYLLLELPDEAGLRALKPDFTVLAASSPDGVCVTAAAQRDGLDFVSRFFAPKMGILEDPVTGSAHCRLGPYWATKLGRLTLKAEQVSARGGSVEVEVAGNRVRLTGHAVRVAEGSLLA